MKIIVQNESTSLYFKDFDSWTEKLNDGREFGSTEEALTFIKTHRLAGCLVIHTFGTPFPGGPVRPRGASETGAT